MSVDEGTGWCDLCPPPPHDEPNDESGEHTKTGEATHNTPNNSTGVGTSFAGVLRKAGGTGATIP